MSFEKRSSGPRPEEVTSDEKEVREEKRAI
jgi:hypothetical protein